MTDPRASAQMVERLRKLKIWDDHPSNGSLGEEAATLIASLEADLTASRKLVALREKERDRESERADGNYADAQSEMRRADTAEAALAKAVEDLAPVRKRLVEIAQRATFQPHIHASVAIIDLDAVIRSRPPSATPAQTEEKA